MIQVKRRMNNKLMKVRIKQATKKGYIECCVPGIADLGFPNSKTRRGRVQGGGGYLSNDNSK